ncbi:MAG TPA: polymer-forming cytoskeletal protein [Candidatus Acidoferrales bacterium]|nr:polymer-forming cytoskeletal protein [Candidatus Acidoferrales bacterium]
MWRKPTVAKPSSQSSSSPSSAPLEQSKTPESASATPAPPKTEGTSHAPAPVSSAPFLSPAAKPPAPAPAPVNSGAFSIPSGLKIHGTISGSSDLSLDSEMHGKIWLTGARLSIGPNGRVHADVEAREIFVNGKLNGNLKAAESVHFGPSARFNGSVAAARISIDDGAHFRGKVEMANGSMASSDAAASESSAAPKASARAAGQVSNS